MADKHLLKVDKIPTDEEFMSEEWTSRLDYVGLVKKDGGGVNTNEVFYNFVLQKVTKLKVKIESPGHYGLGYIGGDISKDKPTIIDWGNDTKTTLTTPITHGGQSRDSTDFYVYYSKSGEYEISIDGWYNRFKCYESSTFESGVTQICKVLTEIVQVSSLITDFRETFYGCSNLTSIPSGLFDKNTEVTSFEDTFSNCSKLTTIPSGLFDNNKDVTSFRSTFYRCSSLKSIPSGLFDNNTKVTDFLNTFCICSNLTNIPDGLFDKNINVTNFSGTFSYCSSLTSIPSGLFDKNTKVTNFSSAFSECYGLTCETPYTKSSDGVTKIKLWQRDEKNGFKKPTETHYAFYACSKLTDYGDIPYDWS